MVFFIHGGMLVSLLQRLILVNLLIPSMALAATQGSLGTTSTGTVTVSITIPALVQISGLSDLTIASASSFPATASTTACIYSNVASPLGSYYVTASSANGSAGVFKVKDSGTDYITYTAYWTDTVETKELASGTKTAQRAGGNSTALDCGSSSNANFNISIAATDVQTVPAATYTDTVTLLISPS